MCQMEIGLNCPEDTDAMSRGHLRENETMESEIKNQTTENTERTETNLSRTYSS